MISGKLQYANGSYYEGEFVRNKFEGKGTYTWPDQKVYRGDWKK